MEIKKIIPYQRSLFILGDAGSERYTLFRSLTSDNMIFERIWHPEEAMFKQCTWVIYTGENQRMLKETAKGFRSVEKVGAVGTYYIAIKRGQIPDNVKLVFPPYHLDEESFKSYYLEHSCLNKSSAFLWLEGFPYGKSDTAQQLRYINDLINERARISVAITQIERKFLSTDIGNVELGIQNAVNYFGSKGYRVLAERAQIPMQRSLLIEALTYRIHFSEKIRHQYFNFIEKVDDSLEFLQDDLRHALEDANLLEALEEAFDFKHVKNQQNIDRIWLQQLNIIYDKLIVTTVKKELYHHYYLLNVKGEVAAEADLKKLFNTVWSDFLKQIKKRTIPIPSNLKFNDELQYELEMKEFKGQWRKEFSILLETNLAETCSHYLHTIVKPYVQNA